MKNVGVAANNMQYCTTIIFAVPACKLQYSEWEV